MFNNIRLWNTFINYGILAVNHNLKIKSENYLKDLFKFYDVIFLLFTSNRSHTTCFPVVNNLRHRKPLVKHFRP